MKAVGKRISIVSVLSLYFLFTYGQDRIITAKKYDLEQSKVIFKVDSTLLNHSLTVPLVFNYDKLALFCKFEEKVAKKSNVNMRFRLGSLDYVNYLEQKPHWQLPKN